MIHFDWTITPMTILSVLWFLAVIPTTRYLHRIERRFQKIQEAMEKIMNWMREYPPHIHEKDEGIRYAKGMAPDRVGTAAD